LRLSVHAARGSVGGGAGVRARSGADDFGVEFRAPSPASANGEHTRRRIRCRSADSEFASGVRATAHSWRCPGDRASGKLNLPAPRLLEASVAHAERAAGRGARDHSRDDLRRLLFGDQLPPSTHSRRSRSNPGCSMKSARSSPRNREPGEEARGRGRSAPGLSHLPSMGRNFSRSGYRSALQSCEDAT
jgi:hypothetical protein